LPAPRARLSGACWTRQMRRSLCRWPRIARSS
jgi:hypothetical protein